MLPVRRKSIFILSATHHGTMIVNRMDYRKEGIDSAVGVGCELLETGAYQAGEIDSALGILELRRRYYGDGVVAIDGGANIGVHTIEWARFMPDWGKVVAVEPQERVYYALAGNIALNNCFNACAIHAAISDADGTILMPVPDYSLYSNFGGLSIKQLPDIGQEIKDWAPVRTLTIDSLKLERCDLIKLDIEGMEIDALNGAAKTVSECHPVLIIEHIRIDNDKLMAFLFDHEYEMLYFGQNVIATHRLDKTLDHLRQLHRLLIRKQADAEAA